MSMRGAPPAKPIAFRATLIRLLRLLAPDRWRIALLLFLAVAAVGMTVAAPRVLGAATDVIFNGVIGQMIPAGTTKAAQVAALRAAGQNQLADMLAAMNVVPGQGIDFGQLAMIVGWVLVLYALAFIFNYSQGFITVGVLQRGMYRLREQVEMKLGRLPMSHFQHQPRGEVLSRVTNDIDNLNQTLTQTLTQIVVSVITIIGVLAMMLSISPLLAIIAVVTVPVSAVITLLIARRSQAQFMTQWKSTGELNSHIEEMFTGHQLIAAFGRERQAMDRFVTFNDSLYSSSAKAQFISGTIMPSMTFVSNLNYVVVAVVGGLQIAAGNISIGSVQAFIQYSRQFTQPLAQLGSMMNMLQSGLASAERVFDLLDSPEQTPDHEPPVTLDTVRGRVAFEHVSFRYEPDTPLIEDVSLAAEPGQTVAIVGHTGAGKTTLVNLLMRFYEIDSGRITLDNVDTSLMTRDDLRSRFGMVLQDAWLFGGTIRDNLRYGAPDATEEQMIAAAEATHVDHFVRSLPEGYDTVIGDDGGGLSQGQMQLVTIARAFLADPAVLLLDEATSSVDTRTEVLIQRAMSRLRQGRTSFVIAHRLSTIRDADLILVMDHGRLVEQGAHAELLAAGGTYHDLYEAQFTEPAVG